MNSRARFGYAHLLNEHSQRGLYCKEPGAERNVVKI